MITIIIPAWNEASCLHACLAAVTQQRGLNEAASCVELVIAANGCSDRTVAIAMAFAPQFEAMGIDFTVLDLPVAGKALAIRAAERIAKHAARCILDADTVIGPDSVAALIAAVAVPVAVFVSGKLCLAPSRSWVTRRYGEALLHLPHFQGETSGAGFYAVSAAGRSRWGEFPDLISDDIFVRSHFAADEIRSTSMAYQWPLPTGWQALVRVRRRQEIGLRELETLCPHLLDRRRSRASTLRSLAHLAVRRPLSAVIFAAVVVRCRFGLDTSNKSWARSR